MKGKIGGGGGGAAAPAAGGGGLSPDDVAKHNKKDRELMDRFSTTGWLAVKRHAL